MRSGSHPAMAIMIYLVLGGLFLPPSIGGPVMADDPSTEPVTIECEEAELFIDEGGTRTLDLADVCHASNGYRLDFEYLGGNDRNVTVALGREGVVKITSYGDYNNYDGEELLFRAYLNLTWNISEDFMVLAIIDCGGCMEYILTNMIPDPAIRINIPEGGKRNFSAEVRHGDAVDPLDLRYTWYIDGREVQKGTNLFVLQPDHDMAGDHIVTLQVRDPGGGKIDFDWYIYVEDTNRRPYIEVRTPYNNTQFSHDEKVVIDILSKDPDGDDIEMKVFDNGKEMKRHRVLGENGTAYLHLKKTLSPGKHVIEVDVTDGESNSTARVEVNIREPPGRGPPCLGCIVTMNIVAVIYHRLRRGRSRA